MRSSAYEQALTASGFKWEYIDVVPIADIDLAAGLRNQARLLQPIITDIVDTYALRMDEGVQFPAVVLWRRGRGRWIPVDGNQRLAASQKCKKKHAAIDAYVIISDDTMAIDRLTWTFNNLVNGVRVSIEECISHAVTFCRKYGYGVDQSAKEWGLPAWRVKKAVKTEHLREVLSRRKVPNFPSITPDALWRLGTLEKIGEDVFAKAVRVVGENGLNHDHIETLINAVGKARTNGDKLSAIDEYASSDTVRVRRAETKGGKIRMPTPLPRDRVLRILREAARLFEDYPDHAAIRPVGPALKEARELAAEVVENLVSTFGIGVVPREAR
ncbi:hypothetical protein AYO40_01000 [Planctomycetaceae bacterium SCGC AG-212-D15]|nr:hypothetical protein AYO40_01000 [Planctomycetaceae bacterium SCGC AG-212-D15]